MFNIVIKIKMDNDIYEIDGKSLTTQKLNLIVKEGKKIDLSP